MKGNGIVLLILIVGSTLSGFSQNILESLKLKDELIQEYQSGELLSTDTIINLKRGFYEEFYMEQAPKTVLRQAKLFENRDGTKTLSISTSHSDSQCFIHETKCYEVSSKGKGIREIPNEQVLPDISIRELLSGSAPIDVIETYLLDIQENYLDSTATVHQVLLEIYDIVYIYSQKRGELTATLRVCDYIPTNVVDFGEDDWSIIEDSISSIRLKYNRRQKRFTKRKTYN